MKTGMHARRNAVSGFAFYVVASILGVVFILPLLWSVFSSIYGPRASGGGQGVGFANYERLVAYGEGVWLYLGNSIWVAFLTVAGTLLVNVLGGYAFARFRFPGRGVLFVLVLSILMVPHATLLVPIYTLLRTLGMQNSLVGVAIVMVMLQLPFSLFLMRNAFEGLPRELEEAALMDGCTHLTALLRILVRAVVPSMVTVAMFAFLASWNEFLAPLILLSTGRSFTLPIALVSLRSGEFGSVDFGALQAGIVVAAVPCLVLFTALQRHYVRGFASGAMKG